MGHLHHETCGKWTSFVDPTDERVRWYVASDRCGPHGVDSIGDGLDVVDTLARCPQPRIADGHHIRSSVASEPRCIALLLVHLV